MKKLLVGLSALVTFAAFSGSALAYSPFNAVCKTGAGSTNSTVCRNKDNNSNPITGKGGILGRVTQLIAMLTGVASVIVIIISGLRMIVSAGDANAIASSRKGILYAVVGLLIALFAQIIVVFVINKI